MRERIQRAVPRKLTELGEQAVSSFLKIPGIDAWRPEKLFGLELSVVFDIGLVLALLRDTVLDGRCKNEIVQATLNLSKVKDSLWGELQVGALVSHLGGRVEFVPRQPHVKTPDIRGNFASGNVVDVEVTTPMLRRSHRDLQSALGELTGAVFAGEMGGHVVGYFADASDDVAVDLALDALGRLRAGEYREELGRWYVAVVPEELRDVALSSLQPTWWDKDGPAFVSTATMLGSPFPRLVTFRSAIPIVSYLDPITTKANRAQHDKNNPFIIALDASNLPRAHDRVIADIQTNFHLWEHVSAVLLLSNRFWTVGGKKEWHVSLHANPYAHHALPSELNFYADGKLHVFTFVLESEFDNPLYEPPLASQ